MSNTAQGTGLGMHTHLKERNRAFEIAALLFEGASPDEEVDHGPLYLLSLAFIT
jgi:hypothetical protein